MKKRLILIDSFSLFHRAFYALPQLKNSKGLTTNALYGLCNMLFKIENDFKPDFMVAALDMNGPTLRHEKYEDYKGHRKAMPDELREQVPFLETVFEGFGIPVLKEEGFEADDLIGSFGKKAGALGLEVFIITGDKDAYQLIDDNISVVMTKKGLSETAIMTEKEIEEIYSLKPIQMIELKALMGDASDNIPGVRGVGEKTALTLLHTYGNIDNLYDNVEQMKKSKLKEKLIEDKDAAYMSHDLATIRIHCDVDMAVLDKEPIKNQEVLKSLFEILESPALMKKFLKMDQEKQKKIAIPIAQRNEAPREDGQLAFNFDQKPKTEPTYAAMDIHDYLNTTVTLYQWEDVFSLHIEEGESRFITVEQLQQIVENDTIEKIVYDSKKWYYLLETLQLEPQGVFQDIMLMGYLSDPSMDMHFTDLIFKHLGVLTEADDYLENSHYIMKVFDLLAYKLKDIHQWSLYYDIERPVAKILYTMEKEGVAVDSATLQNLTEHFKQDMDQLEAAIYEMAGVTFNLNSPKQLGEVLFDQLGLPVIKKTKTGYSTDVEVLTTLSKSYEICHKILAYRSAMKLYSTYCIGIQKLIAEDGKVHTTFQQTVTTTGRLSSTDPNMQNIPIKTEMGRALRKMFVPSLEEGFLLSADYSQIELRLLAHISEDPVLLKGYGEELDVHNLTAGEIFGEVTAETRRRAKAVNFGIVYGMSSFGLSQDLGISPKEAGEYIEKYFNTYKNVKTYIDDTIKDAKTKGYVTTMLGRRRYIPDITHANFQKRSFAERAAVNATIQGSAADLMKRCMVMVDQALNEKGLQSKMVLQVHDELVFDVYPGEVDTLLSLVEDVMTQVLPLRIPLQISISYGKSWFDAK